MNNYYVKINFSDWVEAYSEEEAKKIALELVDIEIYTKERYKDE